MNGYMHGHILLFLLMSVAPIGCDNKFEDNANDGGAATGKFESQLAQQADDLDRLRSQTKQLQQSYDALKKRVDEFHGESDTEAAPAQPDADTPQAEPQLVQLIIKSSPSGAKLRMNGKLVGETPFITSVAPETTLSIDANKPGYRSVSRKVTVSADMSISLKLDEQP